MDMITPEKQEFVENAGQIIEKSREESQVLSTKKPTFEEMMKNLQEEADYLALKETQTNEYFKATHNQSSLNTVSSFIKPVKIDSPDKSLAEVQPCVQEEQKSQSSICDSARQFSSVGCGFLLESESGKEELTLRQNSKRQPSQEEEPPVMRHSIHSLAFSI